MRGRGVEGDTVLRDPKRQMNAQTSFGVLLDPEEKKGREPFGDNFVLSRACVGEKVETTKMPILEGKTKYA